MKAQKDKGRRGRMTDQVERSDKGFRKLIMWQKTHQLVLLIYKLIHLILCPLPYA
jgi:hypothetical protein